MLQSDGSKSILTTAEQEVLTFYSANGFADI